MHFGENQLSRSLIGLSPLSTGHPPSFQPRWVRSSTRSYPRFNLHMDRSLRFGSRWCNYGALFGLAFATATAHALTSLHHANSQAHSSKGTLSQFENCSNGLYAHGFRYYFTPLPGYFSPFPHGTGSLSVVYVYLALRSGLRRFTPAFPDPALLGNTNRSLYVFVYRALTCCGATFQNASTNEEICNSVSDLVLRLSGPTTPNWQRHQALTPVRFRLIPFRSPLLRESLLLSVPWATQMF